MSFLSGWSAVFLFTRVARRRRSVQQAVATAAVAVAIVVMIAAVAPDV